MPPREKSRWRPPVKGTLTTTLSAMHGQVDTMPENARHPVNLRTIIAKSSGGLKLATELIAALKQNNLDHPKPRKAETRPYKTFTDYLARNIGRSRVLRSSISEQIARVAGNKTTLEPSDGLTVLSDVLAHHSTSVSPQELIQAPNINIPSKELEKMSIYTARLLQEIEKGDSLAISVGKSFNQLLLWIEKNQNLAYLGFREIEPLVANLEGNGKFDFGAGMVDLVAIQLPPNSPYTSQQVEEMVFASDKSIKRLTGKALQRFVGGVVTFAQRHLTDEMTQALGLSDTELQLLEKLRKGNFTKAELVQLAQPVQELARWLPLREYVPHSQTKLEISGYQRKSGQSVQELLQQKELLDVLNRPGTNLIILDFKQRSTAPDPYDEEMEIAQLLMYSYPLAPDQAIRAGSRIQPHNYRGASRIQKAIARNLELQVLTLEEEQSKQRPIERTERQRGPLTARILRTLHQEEHARTVWDKTVQHGEALRQQTLPGMQHEIPGSDAPPFLPEFITPEFFNYPDVVAMIRDRKTERTDYATERLNLTIEGMRDILKGLLETGDAKRGGALVLNTIENFSRGLTSVATYQQLYPLLKRFTQGSRSKFSVPIRAACEKIDELRLQYFVDLERQYPELAYLRSVLETTADSRQIPLYDLMILLLHNVEENSHQPDGLKIMTRYPDGTITAEVILPNFPYPVIIALPKYKEYAYFFVPENLDDYNDVLNKFNGPPYRPLIGKSNLRGKVHILQRNGKRIVPALLDRPLRRAYKYIQAESFPFLTGPVHSRNEISAFLSIIKQQLPDTGPQLSTLREMGIPDIVSRELLGLRFTPTIDGLDHLTEQLVNLGWADETYMQLGLTNRSASIWNAVVPEIRANLTVFPLTAIEPLRDEAERKHLPLIGFAGKSLKQGRDPLKANFGTWLPPAYADHTRGYYQIGDLSKAKKLLIAGNPLDAATLFTMFQTFGLDTNGICIASPVNTAYAQLADDIKRIRLNFRNIEKVEVLRGALEDGYLTGTLENHGLKVELRERRVTVEFWRLVHEALVLSLPRSSVRTDHSRVNNLWKDLLNTYGAKVIPTGVVFPNSDAEQRVRGFVEMVYNAIV